MRSFHFSALVAISLLMTGCSTGHYRQNVVEETYVHKYGVTVPQEDWTDRGKHGKVISTLDSGVVETKNYASGVLHGETTYTFPHSQSIHKIHTYSHGQLMRNVEHYHSGQPMKKTDYFPPDSKSITIWYENGSPQSVEQYTGDLLINGEYYTPLNQIEAQVQSGSGDRVKRDLYGQLVSYDIFMDGQIVQRETYHPNGTPKEVASYHNGEMHGQKKTFTPGGEPESVEHYRKGKREGICTVFDNGEKVCEIPYAHNLKHGTERHFGNENEVVEEVTWVNDKKHGPSNTYIGEHKKTEWHYQGKKVSKYHYDQLQQWDNLK